MKFRPLHDRVVVRRIEGQEKTAGGIIIPDTAKEKPMEGEIVAVGPGGRDENGKLIGTGEFERMDVQMVLRSVGYQSVPLPGIPFDERSYTVPNAEGRVLGADEDAILGALQAGGERMWPRMGGFDWAGRGADTLSPQTYPEWPGRG